MDRAAETDTECVPVSGGRGGHVARWPAAFATPASQFGHTPVQDAAANGHGEVVCALLDRGADLEARDSVRQGAGSRGRVARGLPQGLGFGVSERSAAERQPPGQAGGVARLPRSQMRRARPLPGNKAGVAWGQGLPQRALASRPPLKALGKRKQASKQGRFLT